MSTAALIAALLTIDPKGLGGAWVRARHGPARESLLSALSEIPGKPLQIRPGMDTHALFGGVDLTASLTAGRLVTSTGAMGDGCVLRLTQAERMVPGLAAQIAARFDDLNDASLILLDEGTEDDGLPLPVLRERLAFFLHEGSDIGAPIDVRDAVSRLADVTMPEALMADCVLVAAQLGVVGMRPVLFAVATARAHAALNRRTIVTSDDLDMAAQLVFAHRATAAPDAPEDNAPPPPQSADHTEADSAPSDTSAEIPRDAIVEAAQTALPAGVLAALALRSRLAQGSGEGLSRVSDTRGRPIPSRPGRIDGRKRIDLLATLQTAAPWQALRGRDGRRLELRAEDVRMKRYRDRSERLLIFAVDASGSAAMARLAEAKGAAEMLLAEAYENRDKVCLTVFRDTGAEVIVPPTRSLTRAKRLLSALPAGGATPLAAGLALSRSIAETAKRAGQAPQVILLTDGRANRALDGSTDRAKAGSDATQAARSLRASGTPVVILDSGRRASRHLSELADTLAADVVPLPRLARALTESKVDA